MKEEKRARRRRDLIRMKDKARRLFPEAPLSFMLAEHLAHTAKDPAATAEGTGKARRYRSDSKRSQRARANERRFA